MNSTPSRRCPAAVRLTCSTSSRRSNRRRASWVWNRPPRIGSRLATFSGAARLAEQSDTEPALLRAQVTSKGGTTERAVGMLDDAAVMSAIVAAVKAAAERARELGDRFGNEP